MPYLVSNLIAETRNELNGTVRTEWNLTNGTGTAVATTITLRDDMRGVDFGTILGVGNEEMRVRSVSGQVATVIRSWNGTTAATWADNAPVEINPRFSVSLLRRTLRDVIRAWPHSLFTPASEILPVGSGQRLFKIGRADAYGVCEVRRDPSSALDVLSPSLSRDTYPVVRGWELVRSGPATAAGVGFQIKEYVPAGNLYVTYGVPFDVSDFDDAVDLEVDVGLASTMLDIPRIGAIAQCLAWEQVRRVDLSVQSQPRIAAEVPPGEIIQSAAFYTRLHDRRQRVEADRLRQVWGIKMSS